MDEYKYLLNCLALRLRSIDIALMFEDDDTKANEVYDEIVAWLKANYEIKRLT